MKISKRVSKILTLLVAFLLSLLVVIAFISYLADKKIKISYEITASVSGSYRLTAFYTDGKGQEINRNDNSRKIVSETRLIAGVPALIELKKNADQTKRLEKIELLFEKIGATPHEDLSLKISNLNVNHKTVADLFVKSQDQESIFVEKCHSKDCSASKKSDLTLSLTQGPRAIYVDQDLHIKSYYTHFAKSALLIIIIVNTALFYKLIRTALHIRSQQEIKAYDFIFVVAVAITFLIPILGVKTDHNVVENNENRMLNEYKPLFTADHNHPINLNWMKDFENYFNDRFGGRKQLIGAEKKATLFLNHIIYAPNAGVCQKENSWCFNKEALVDETTYLVGSSVNPLLDLEKIERLAQKTEIPIYVLLYPFKTEIYPDKILYYKKTLKNANGFSDYAMEQLAGIKAKNVHIINLTPIFKEDRKQHPNELLYFIDEHHATEYANKVVMDYLNTHVPVFKKYNFALNIDSKYPSVRQQTASGEFILNLEHDFWGDMIYGQTWGNVFGHSNRKTKTKYFKPQYYPFYSLTPKYVKDVTYSMDSQCDANIHLHNNNAPQLKVYVLGNSFVETLSKMVATSASDVYRRRINTPCGQSTLTPEGVVKQLNELQPDVILMAVWIGTRMP